MSQVVSFGEMEYVSPSSVGPNWSKLPLDLLQFVFERLGFADFERSKSVCSSWYDASKKSSPKNQTPWLILFPKKGNDYCMLFNPEEKEKLRKIQNLGVKFANINCLATHGNWLLMQDPQYNLYIINILTRERIELPSIKSQYHIIEMEQTEVDKILARLVNNRDVLFWIDEKTKHYVVMIQKFTVLLYSRKSDKFWKHIEVSDYYSDMVYKDHKLYMYSCGRDAKILDFSEDIPQQIFETQLDEWDLWKNGLGLVLTDEWIIKTEHLVVRVNGEIIKVKSKVWNNSDVWSFGVYKMDLSNSGWERLNSLGDEAILLDLGITVLANTIEEVNANSIYFSGCHCDSDRVWSEKDILIFNLSTNKVERPHRSTCSSIQLSNARWFIPTFLRN